MIGLESSAEVLGLNVVMHLLVYCRVQAMLLSLPAFSERLLPARMKIGLALCLTPLMTIAAGEEVKPATPLALALLALAEVMTGFMLGMLVRLASIALDIASSAIATTASLSQIMGVTNEFAPHPIGNLLHLAGLAVIMAMGFPLFVCDLLLESFDLRHIGQWPEIAVVMPAAVGVIANCFLLAMLLASPFVLGGLLFQCLSGIVSKVMPTLPVVFVGAPAAILLALIALSLITPVILSVWADHIFAFVPPEHP